MDNKELKNILENLNIENTIKKLTNDKLSDLFEYVQIDMGKPIVLAEEIPKYLFILLEGKVRQLFENPLNKEIMTLETIPPYHVVGLKSCKANYPVEFVTAATDCKFAKISYKNWQSLFLRINQYQMLDNKVQSYEVLPMLEKSSEFSFPTQIKELRKFIKEVALESEIKNIKLPVKFSNLKLDENKNWYFASSFEQISYGSIFNFEELNTYVGNIRILGIPKKLTNQN